MEEYHNPPGGTCDDGSPYESTRHEQPGTDVTVTPTQPQRVMRKPRPSQWAVSDPSAGVALYQEP